MWSYYGSKSKIVDYYPPPKFDKIIEPFAGSARYSLKYWQNDILLVDKYDVIVDLWNYLKQCNKNDILNLPTLIFGEQLKKINYLSKEEKLLLGFIICQGVSRPKNTVGTLEGCSVKSQKALLKNIAGQLYKIKHWNIVNKSYEVLENIDATWFIDPPYQFGGHVYKESNKKLDFNELSKWCKTRQGHIIVCENTKATWLPFLPMIKMKGTVHKTTEAIWSNYKTNYEYQQQSLF